MLAKIIGPLKNDAALPSIAILYLWLRDSHRGVLSVLYNYFGNSLSNHSINHLCILLKLASIKSGWSIESLTNLNLPLRTVIFENGSNYSPVERPLK